MPISPPPPGAPVWSVRSQGVRTKRPGKFAEPGYPDIDNLYARLGAQEPCLMFAAHTDVVPPGDSASWRFDPFTGEIAEGMLWGRGAVDMKGGLAAALAATLAFLDRRGRPPGSIAFLITGDEEGPAVNGTVKLLEWAAARGERFDHCILPEPTNPDALGDMIKIGRRGSLSGALLVRGKQGHVGYPHLADNPVHHIVRLVAALRASPLDQGTAHFDASNLEVTSIDVGNQAVNVIPAEARAQFNIRFNDLWTPETLEAEIRARLGAAAQGAGATRSASSRPTLWRSSPSRGHSSNPCRGRSSRSRVAGRRCRRPAARRTPDSSAITGRCSSSASSGGPCTPWTSAPASTTSSGFPPFSNASLIATSPAEGRRARCIAAPPEV
jgi:acetylornithine deacetylase/succinyl-diaminopimelate desuccinylase-like protein